MARRSGESKRRWLWLLLGAVTMIVVALGAILVVDVKVFRAPVERAVSEALGMEVGISGPVRLGLWPPLQVSAGPVRLERQGLPVAEAETVRLRLAAAPLVFGNLRVRHLDVAGADISVVRHEAVRFNFLDPEREPGGGALPGATFSAVSISYEDEPAGLRLRASGCRGRLSDLVLAKGQGFAGLEAGGEIACDSLSQNGFEVAEVEFDVRVAGGRVELDPVTAGILGSAGRGRLDMDFLAAPPRLSAEFDLEDFELEPLLRVLAPEAQAQGRMNFSAELSAYGDGLEAVTRSLEGTLSLRGAALTIHGFDLDERLADWDSARRFGLVDAGAVLLAGPVGLAVTRGYEFSRLLRPGAGSTEFRELVSEWQIREGVAEAADVAAATGENRIAVRGGIDFAARSYDGLTVSVLDSQGCSVMDQTVSGPFDDPQVEQPGTVKTLLGPLMDLVERGIEQLAGDDCEVVYDGRVSAPGG